jgi:hypothetical protein
MISSLISWNFLSRATVRLSLVSQSFIHAPTKVNPNDEQRESLCSMGYGATVRLSRSVPKKGCANPPRVRNVMRARKRMIRNVYACVAAATIVCESVR